MNPFKKMLSVLACSLIAACAGDKEEQAAENPNATNTVEGLITPEISTQASSGNLQDIWVLDSMNNIAPDSTYFAHGTPYFDLNLEKNTITGHTGCNGLNGKLKVNGDKLLFDSLVLTKQVCNDKGFEKKLVAGFKGGNTSYRILNDKLHLNVGPGSNLIFRRIRR
jgi:heat shock protein HslJ